MHVKKLVRFAIGVGVLCTAGLGVASAIAAGSGESLVPDCDCTVHNWPNPGDSLPGLRVDGECFLDPCAS